MNNYFTVASRDWKKVISIAVLTALLAALVSFVRPLEYSSTIRLLIIQRSALGLDPYTAIRSAERVSESLASIVYTTSFFDKVLAAGYSIDQNVFSKDETKRRKQWQKMVEAQVSRGTGLLTIIVYHRDRGQAEQIVSAIGAVLQQEGWTYVGGGDLQVRVVDAPISSRFPVRPNVPVNAFGGFVLGMLGGIGYVVWLSKKHPPHGERSFLHE
ncbi:MAG: hypothetical protein Q8P82_02830 [bacterium]|nr:hypothetical protein [bacterium]